MYWTQNAKINLPPAIVERFKGKVMAITGYEIDQVYHPGPQEGSTTSGDILGGSVDGNKKSSDFRGCERGD